MVGEVSWGSMMGKVWWGKYGEGSMVGELCNFVNLYLSNFVALLKLSVLKNFFLEKKVLCYFSYSLGKSFPPVCCI